MHGFHSKPVIVLIFYSPSNYKVSEEKLSRFDFTVINKPSNKIRFPLPKNPIPLLDHSGEYCIPCECGLSYIGQIKRALKLRAKEHERCF